MVRLRTPNILGNYVFDIPNFDKKLINVVGIFLDMQNYRKKIVTRPLDDKK